MTDEFKFRRDLLTANLRSGEFEQGRDRLRSNNDRYCCLGVACEVFQRETGRGGWTKESNVDPYAYWLFRVDGEQSWSNLPRPVAEWFGFTDTNPHVKTGEGRMKSLASLNDEGTLFPKIADLIDGVDDE